MSHILLSELQYIVSFPTPSSWPESSTHFAEMRSTVPITRPKPTRVDLQICRNDNDHRAGTGDLRLARVARRWPTTIWREAPSVSAGLPRGSCCTSPLLPHHPALRVHVPTPTMRLDFAMRSCCCSLLSHRCSDAGQRARRENGPAQFTQRSKENERGRRNAGQHSDAADTDGSVLSKSVEACKLNLREVRAGHKSGS